MTETRQAGDGADRRPTRTLLASVAHLLAEIMRHEAALVRAELTVTVDRLRRGSVLFMAGLVLSACGVAGLLGAAVLAVCLVLPPWAATLAIAGPVLLIGLVFIWAGWHRLATTSFAPERVLAALRRGSERARPPEA